MIFKSEEFPIPYYIICKLANKWRGIVVILLDLVGFLSYKLAIRDFLVSPRYTTLKGRF